MIRFARWGLQEGYAPYWAGSEFIDGDYTTVAVFLTKLGALWWRWTRGTDYSSTSLRLVRLDKR